MKRFKRALLMTVGAILLLLVILILLVPRLVPTDLITEKVVREVERATGATVTLAEARISWRWQWRVTLRDGSITGTGAALAAATGSPTDLETYALTLRELSVTPALLPLLRKQVKINEVVLAGPKLEATWDRGQAMATGFRLHLTDLNLGLEQPPATGRSAAPGALIPPDLAFGFTGTADTLVLQRAPYTHLEMKGGFAGKVLEVTSLSAHRSTGELTGNLTVDYLADPWGRLTFAGEVQNVPAEALLEPWAPDIGRRLASDLNASAVGGCDLRDAPTRIATLDIAGTVTGSEGVLHARDWLADVSKYLGDRQDLMDVRFRKLAHDFRLVQGRYMIESLTLGGGETDWLAKGWVALEGNLALGIDVKLPPGFTPDLGNFSFLAQTLRDADGRINLPLTLSGASARPTVGVDLGRLRNP